MWINFRVLENPSSYTCICGELSGILNIQTVLRFKKYYI